MPKFYQQWNLCILFLFIFIKIYGQEEAILPKPKPVIKKNKNFKPIADTLQIDTLVIVYKKKDTSILVKKYKGKIPQMKTSLGGFKNGDKTNAETMKALLDSPLVIKDEKGNDYKVVSYRFCYKKKDVYVEDEKMEVKVRYDFFALQISQNPLPERYKKDIQPEVREEEQFWFENIIVENPKGEKFLSSDMTLITY